MFSVNRLLYLVVFLKISSLISLSQEPDPIPYVDFALPTINPCRDSTFTFSNLGKDSLYYTWEVNDVFVSHTYNLTFTLHNEGINYVKLTVDSNGYTNSIAKQIKIEAHPDFYEYIKPDTAVCQHSTVNFGIPYSSKSTSYELWENSTNLLISKVMGNGGNLVLHKDSIINTGLYTIIGSNSCGSVNYGTYKTRVKSTPAKSLSFSFRDTLFCNSGVPELKVKNSESAVNYQVYYYSNVFLSQMGNGGDLNFVLPETQQTRTYDIVGVSTVSGCQRKFTSDTIFIDKVNSGFSLSQKNLYLNEPLKCFDNSHGTAELLWTLSDQSESIHFNSKNVSHAYITPGFKKIKLMNETEFGCKDSSEKQIFVHDTLNYLKSGWSINGGRIETWEGRNNPPAFSIDKKGNAYIAGEFEVNPNTTLISSFRGIDLISEKAELGAFLVKYDKYGLLKWHIKFIAQIRPDVGCVKVIHDSVIFLSLASSYPYELITPDGNSITINEKKIVALFDTEGYLIRYFSVKNTVTSIEIDHDGNLYLLEYEKKSVSVSPCVLTKYNSSFDSLWSVNFTYSNSNNILGKPQINISENGNTYVLGCFDRDMNVIANNGSFTILFNLLASGNDIYFFMINSDGNYKWGNTGFTKNYNKNNIGMDVASDHLGNVYITGRISNATLYLTSSDSSTINTDVCNYFTAKYDSTGKYIWSVGAKMTKSGYWVGGNSLVSDYLNNIYVLGTVMDDCIFTSTNSETSYHFVSNAVENLYIAQYDLNGVLRKVWQTKNKNIKPWDLAMDQESNVYLFAFNSPYNYAFEIQNTVVDLHKEEFLLTKFSKRFSTDTISILNNFPVDYCKNELMPIVFSHNTGNGLKENFQAELSDHEGSFKNSMILGSMLTSSPTDTIITKIPPDIQAGNKYRIRLNNVSKGSLGQIYGHDLSIHTTHPDLKTVELSLFRGDSILINNRYHSTPEEFYDSIISSIGCDTIVKYIITYNNAIRVSECDHYVSPSGKYIWTETGTYYDTIPGQGDNDSILIINLSIKKNMSSEIVEVCDEYISPSDKYVWSSSGVYQDTLINVSGCDSIITVFLTVKNSTAVSETVSACDEYVSPSGKYVWKSSGVYMDTLINIKGCDSLINVNLTISNSVTVSKIVAACNEYRSPSGHYTWTNSGVYRDTLINVSGCDSVITVILTVTDIDTSITKTDQFLMSEDYGSFYQWLDCNNNYSEIAGQNQQTFIPSSNGCFAVEIEKNGCIDTSFCHCITALNSFEVGKLGLINIYPNPSSGKIFVNFQEVQLIREAAVTDLNGKEVNARITKFDQQMIIEINEGPGVYFLKLTTEKKTEVFKLIKK